MTNGQRTLVLVRHAKSSWELDVDDHERPLSSRGRRDGVALGTLLQSVGVKPDLVLCSPAVRTRETWDRAVQGGARASEVRYKKQIYHAGVSELVALVREVSDAVLTLLILGHAPGIADLVEHVARHPAELDAWAQAAGKFPTSACATVTLSVPWRGLTPEVGKLTSFQVPRD